MIMSTTEELIKEQSHEILGAFKDSLRVDKKAQGIKEEINKLLEKGLLEENIDEINKLADDYAFRVADILSDEFKKFFNGKFDTSLLDGMSFTYDTAKGLTVANFAQATDEVNSIAKIVNDEILKTSGFNIKSKTGDIDFDRILNIAQKMTTYENYEDSLYLLDKDTAEGILTDALQNSKNMTAKAANDLGISVRIVRTVEAGACKWCRAKAGSYTYEEASQNDFEVCHRHNNCHCQIKTVYDKEKTFKKIR